jgi:methionine-rich copper-binding protein CopC
MIKVKMKIQLNIAFLKGLSAPIIAAAFVFAAPSAHAHARLIHSTPQSGTSLAQSPPQIELSFNELLDGGEFNSIAVFPSSEARDKTRADLTAGKPQVDARERTRLTINLKPLPPGEYTVEWRVLSLDGHTAPGRFKFKVAAAK